MISLKETLRRIPNDRKFAELILYVAEKSREDEMFGRTKLNKILVFSDFVAFKRLGSAITWQAYQKLDKGPAPRLLLPILRKMKEDGDADEELREYFSYTQRRVVAKRKPDLKIFSAEEIAIVDEVVDYFRNHSATDVSDASHTLVGWKVADMNEDIPYETILIDNDPEADETDVAFAASLVGVANRCLGNAS